MRKNTHYVHFITNEAEYTMIDFPQHYVCFHCKIGGKYNKIVEVVRCKNCQEKMINIGEKFRLPKKDDIKGWENTQSIYNKNKNYYRFGIPGAPVLPGEIHNNIYIPRRRDIGYFDYNEKSKISKYPPTY